MKYYFAIATTNLLFRLPHKEVFLRIKTHCAVSLLENTDIQEWRLNNYFKNLQKLYLMVLYISLITETSSSCRKNNCYVPFLEYKYFRNEAEQLFLKPAETGSFGTL